MTDAATVRNAAGWSFLTGLVAQLGQVVVSLMLAAILGPERFGVVALATLYVLFVEFLIRQGVVQAIIQREDLRDAHLDSAFVMVMSTAVVLSGATLAVAGPLATAFDAPALRDLLMVMAGVSLFPASWQVPVAMVEREMDFRGRAFVLNAGVTAGGAVGVIAALSGAGEYSVAWQLYTQGIVTVWLMYRQSTWRPRLRFERRAARELLGFSSGALLASLGAFVSQRVDTIVVGAFFGPLAVGLYRFASRFVQLITNITAGALGRVGLAALSRVQNQPERFADQAVRLTGSSSALTAPMLALVFVGARITSELFGEEWEPAAPVMRVLAIAGIARVLVIYTNPIQQARGQAHRSAAALWFASAVSIGAVAIAGVALGDRGVETQVEGIAWARLVSQAGVITPVFFVLIAVVAATSVRRVVASVVPSLAVSAVVIAAGLPVDEWMSRTDLAIVVQGLVVGTVSTAVAAAGVLITSDEARRILRRILRPVTLRGTT